MLHASSQSNQPQNPIRLVKFGHPPDRFAASREIGPRLERQLPSIAVGFVLLVIATVSRVAAQESIRPLRIEDAVGALDLQIQSILGSASPDGRFFAYTVCDPRRVAGDSSENKSNAKASPYRSQGCDIHVVATADRTIRKISSEKGGSWGPSWSPDGSRLAFQSDRDGAPRVWIWDASSNAARR